MELSFAAVDRRAKGYLTNFGVVRIPYTPARSSPETLRSLFTTKFRTIQQVVSYEKLRIGPAYVVLKGGSGTKKSEGLLWAVTVIWGNTFGEPGIRNVRISDSAMPQS